MATMHTQTYWLPGHPRMNSTTGKEVCEPRGPFCVCKQGCAWVAMTEAEVREYVKELHGVEPVKVEIGTIQGR